MKNKGNGKAIEEEPQVTLEDEIVPDNIFDEVKIDWDNQKIKKKLVEFLENKMVELSQVPEIVR